MGEIVLPKEIIKASTSSPQLLIIFSAPKIGKTTIAAELPNNLIIDLENGSDFVSALKVKASTVDELNAVCKQIIADGRPYKYVTLDTATALEDMCMGLALKLYQRTAMGKTYTGDILSLPNGAGYKYLRDAYGIMLDKVRKCADHVILLGHTKDKLVEKKGKEVLAKELALTGKLSSITCAHADAIGYLYKEGNKCIISFNNVDDVICGARPKHLRNGEFVISEEIDGNIVTHWDKIFVD